MAPDSPTDCLFLARLCRAAHAAGDLNALFEQVAWVLHEHTRCAWVGLVLAPGAADPPGFATDFTGSPDGRAVPPPAGPSEAVRWVLEHRRPRIVRTGHRSTALPEEQYLLGQGFRGIAHLPLARAGDGIGVLILASRHEDIFEAATVRLLDEAAGLLALALDGLISRARVAELERTRREMVYLRDEIKTDRDLRLLTGESAAMKAVRLAVQQVARTDSTVLVLGETGTGKELVARAIHQLSARRGRLLVAVNCAALAPGLLPSELFGHEQGAFTGATRRRVGRFELAHQGTLFLDEVGELPPEVQVVLLRVLQERRIERVGGTEPIPADVRVIAATHRDLSAAVAEGRFRADLFFRLNVFPIRVPPLRERRDDIPDLVRHFAQHLGRRMNRPVAQVSPATMRLLMQYPWPGNVRELENLVERALIVSAGDTLEVDPQWLRRAPAGGADGAAGPGLAELERRAIREALERCKGKIYGPGGAAEALGLKPTTLYGKMRKHHIDRRPPAR